MEETTCRKPRTLNPSRSPPRRLTPPRGVRDVLARAEKGGVGVLALVRKLFDRDRAEGGRLSRAYGSCYQHARSTRFATSWRGRCRARWSASSASGSPSAGMTLTRRTDVNIAHPTGVFGISCRFPVSWHGLAKGEPRSGLPPDCEPRSRGQPSGRTGHWSRLGPSPRVELAPHKAMKDRTLGQNGPQRTEPLPNPHFSPFPLVPSHCALLSEPMRSSRP